MHLYLTYHISQLDVDEALNSVSDQRRQQTLALKPLGSRQRSLAAYLLLCRALKDAYGISGQPHLSFHENGKPFLTDYPELHFNLSHCREAVACAVDRLPVGVDVEHLRPFNEELIRYVCSDEEWMEIKTATDRDWEFLKLWTQKEAALKLSGVGLRTDIRKALQSDIRLSTLELPQQHCVCSVASYEPFTLPTPVVIHL